MPKQGAYQRSVEGKPRSNFSFFQEYLRNTREIGAVGPDSRGCVQSLLRFVPFATAKIIIEFGSASGAVTREIIRQKKRGTLLICFEKNAVFYDRLARDIAGENVVVLNRDAFLCKEYLRDRFGMRSGGVDCIVSTLPCSSLGMARLLDVAVVPLLARDGVFIQYMHTLSALKGFRLEPMLRRRFASANRDIVVRNLPPALVYACRSSMRTGCSP